MPKGPRNVKQIYIGNTNRLYEKLTQPIADREQTVVCNGGKCFNPLKGKKRIQRDWVQIRRHPKDGLKGYETGSDAPYWQWLRSMRSAADRVLKVAKLPKGRERDRQVARARHRVEELLRREVEGEPARKLKKYLLERGRELWTRTQTGGRADSNPAEQGIGSTSR